MVSVVLYRMLKWTAIEMVSGEFTKLSVVNANEERTHVASLVATTLPSNHFHANQEQRN